MGVRRRGCCEIFRERARETEEERRISWESLCKNWVCLILRKSVEQEEEKVGVLVFWGFGVSWIDSERETESKRGSWLQPGHSYLGFFSNHNPGKLLEFGSRLGFFWCN